MKTPNYIQGAGATKALNPVYIRVEEAMLEYVTTTLREYGRFGRYMAVRAVEGCPGNYLILFDRSMGPKAAMQFAKDGITVHDDDPSIHMERSEAKEFLDSPTTHLSVHGEAALMSLKQKLDEEEPEEEEEEEDKEEEEEEEEEYDENNPKPIECTSCHSTICPDDIEVRVYLTGYVPAESSHHVDSDGDNCFDVGDIEYDELEEQEKVLVCPNCGANGTEDLFDGVYSID
jgi:hypothetical protein